MRAILVVLSLTLLAGCGGGQGPVAAPTPATSTLSGQVVNAATVVGIAGATVEVADGTNAGKRATTDSNGRYEMTDLTFGAFVLTARATGYRDNSQNVIFTDTRRVVNFGMSALQ